jgi:hypothetical protein
LDKDIVTSVVGFAGGGPVSLRKLGSTKVYVTCELSLHPQQKPSTDGLRFELLSVGSFDEETCRALFTSLATCR